jgi:hypothetical protein
MTWKLTLLVLASGAMLASTPASARYYRHSHYHHFHFYSGHRYYSNPSAPGGGMLSPNAAWNGSSPGSTGGGGL